MDGVGLLIVGLRGVEGREGGTGVRIVGNYAGRSFIARLPARKPNGDGGTKAEGAPTGLGIVPLSNGGRKALRAPAAEESGTPFVRLAIAPLKG